MRSKNNSTENDSNTNNKNTKQQQKKKKKQVQVQVQVQYCQPSSNRLLGCLLSFLLCFVVRLRGWFIVKLRGSSFLHAQAQVMWACPMLATRQPRPASGQDGQGRQRLPAARFHGAHAMRAVDLRTKLQEATQRDGRLHMSIARPSASLSSQQTGKSQLLQCIEGS